MGFDLDYPIHRHYLWSRHIELTLGGASQHLARLGDLLAAS
jgi:acyl-CoA dehydrogenase